MGSVAVVAKSSNCLISRPTASDCAKNEPPLELPTQTHRLLGPAHLAYRPPVQLQNPPAAVRTHPQGLLQQQKPQLPLPGLQLPPPINRSLYGKYVYNVSLLNLYFFFYQRDGVCRFHLKGCCANPQCEYLHVADGKCVLCEQSINQQPIALHLRICSEFLALQVRSSSNPYIHCNYYLRLKSGRPEMPNVPFVFVNLRISRRSRHLTRGHPESTGLDFFPIVDISFA